MTLAFSTEPRYSVHCNTVERYPHIHDLTMHPIRIGLIGLGRHGMRYAKHLLAHETPGILTAVCRQNVEVGQSWSQQHHLRFHGRYQDLVHDPQVDAVIIVTPPHLMLPIALEAILAKKPVLIEKPLTGTGIEARHLVETANRHHVPIMTAQTLRYENTINALKNAGHEAGTWKYIVLTSRLEIRPGEAPVTMDRQKGVLLEFGIHQLDLVRFLTEDEVYKVRCELERPQPSQPEVRAWVSLVTHSGLSCWLDISRVSHSRATRVEIVGEHAQLIADWTSRELSHCQGSGQIERQGFSPSPTLPQVISGFLTALRENTPMPISGTDGQRAVEIADACYESAQSEEWVILS